jgi:hypothetical protein
MIAKFIPFCLCLFNAITVAAQLDFGTYRVINRASQSTLCSHRTGDPIYVSKEGYACSRELWELGLGDGRGLYTIKNIDLNSYVQANESSGSSVTISNDKTSFTISFSRGNNGHIIKFPDSDLAWTVAPMTSSYGNILLQPESGDGTQLWTLIRTDGISHNPPAEFSVQTRDSQEENRNLAFLRGIEKLGGSASYRIYLESPHTMPNYTHIVTLSNTFTSSIYASGDLWSAVIYTKIEVMAGEYSGEGHAWGIGIGGIAFIGALSYGSWDELTSAENGITIIGGGAGANALVVIFSVNGADAAVLTVAGLGGGVAVGLHGSFTWKYCGNDC